MKQILLFILLGLGPGALIAGIALGVVLMYRGAGIINLATGGIAMLSGYAFWALRTDQLGVQMSTGPALVVGLAFVAVVGVAVELITVRPLRTASPLAKLVSSLGVLLIAQAAVVLAFGTTPQNEPGILPQDPVALLGAVIPVDRFILTGIVVVMAAALAALYRWSRFGLATRAASENQVAAMLGGLSPNRLSLANTLIASLAAGGLGILAASITELDSETLPLQIVPALAAALLARFTSFGVACAAGIGLGIIDSLIQYVSSLSWFPTAGGIALPGVQELVAFAIIVATMFLRGGRLPGRGDLIEQRLPIAPRPRNLVPTAAVVGLICAVGLVVLPFDFREALVNTLIGTVMALSLVVLTGFVGQISVVQLTLAGVAGFVISHFAVNFGIGFPLAPIIGTAVAVLLGMITAVSALRVRGVALAVVTLAAAVAIQNFGFLNPTWGGGQAGSPVPEPHLLGLDLGPRSPFRGLDGNLPSPVFGWVVLVITLLLCLLVGAVRRGDLGRRMLAVRSNERAAAAASINPRNVKLAAFAISALVAGTAGSLYAYNFGSVSADRFDAFTALSLIAFAYAGGITLISGAAFAGLISTQALFPYALDKWFGLSGTWFLLFGGVILIVTLIQNPEGVAGAFYRRTHRRPTFSPELGRLRGPGPRRGLRHGAARRARTVRPAGPVGERTVGGLRRCPSAERGRPPGRRGRARRAHRAQRRRQDDPDRRGHRVRALHRAYRARRARCRRRRAVSARPPRLLAHLAGHRAVRRSRCAREPDGGRRRPRVGARAARRHARGCRRHVGGDGAGADRRRPAERTVGGSAQARRPRARRRRHAAPALPRRARGRA